MATAPSLAPGHRRRGGGARLQGDPPSPVNLPKGCRFASRCPIAVEDCRQRMPALRQLAPGQAVACHLA
ncbi:oligopeptide/dipeptide ABC transporter ATP-binding protein [Paracoccus sp. N5]|uniref:oligopeptide/dipeptide ABC transporter ATP-binding protein n=1 Tax=Paracoccus sp. N5 TaxID=1101189 RepID=UPI003204DF90